MTSIRALQKADDLRELVALSQEFFAEYAAHHEEFFQVDELRDSDIVQFFSRSIESEDGATFIAVAEARTVGYITVAVRSQPGMYRVKRVGAISGLMVQRDYRRRGIGSQLLNRAVAFFEEKGIKYFTLYTVTANQGALEFYAQRGLAPLQTVLLGRTDRPASD